MMAMSRLTEGAEGAGAERAMVDMVGMIRSREVKERMEEEAEMWIQ
jgi:hypothetical protein